MSISRVNPTCRTDTLRRTTSLNRNRNQNIKSWKGLVRGGSSGQRCCQGYMGFKGRKYSRSLSDYNKPSGHTVYLYSVAYQGIIQIAT